MSLYKHAWSVGIIQRTGTQEGVLAGRCRQHPFSSNKNRSHM